MKLKNLFILISLVFMTLPMEQEEAAPKTICKECPNNKYMVSARGKIVRVSKIIGPNALVGKFKYIQQFQAVRNIVAIDFSKDSKQLIITFDNDAIISLHILDK